jgi:hypothetical protein
LAALTSRGIAGRCRRHGCQSGRWRREWAQTVVAGGTAWATLLEGKGKQAIPTQPWRWWRWRPGRERWALRTKVLGPEQWSVSEALRLYPWRWKGERWFFALQEVVHLPRFSTSSPNGVAMQGSATALGHTALRVAQGHIAPASGIEPAERAPAKFFPRLAAASIGLTWAALAFLEMPQAHPGRALSQPAGRLGDVAWTTLERMQVEPRHGRRQKRRFCQSRKQWTSLTHIPGGKKLT